MRTGMLKRKQGRLGAFRRDKRGGVAIMSALFLMPLSLLAFGAVEYNRYAGLSGDLQDALDSATLAVARSRETDPGLLQALGMEVLTKTLSDSRTGFTIGAATFVDLDGNVTGRATIRITPIVSSLFTASDLSATANSKASRLGQKLEIALVLDNTYSMLTNNRLGITKEAASAFVDKLNEAALESRVPDALKISLVPYSTTVNVGSQHQNAAWMDTAAVNPIHHDIFDAPSNRFTLFSQMGVAWAGCVESRVFPFDAEETAPWSGDPRTLFVPYFAPDENDSWTYRLTNNYLPDATTATGWQERQKNAAKYVVAPTPTTWTDSGYSGGPNYGCKLQPVVRLTTDVASVKAGIAAMTPTGDTYTNIGLMWGWHTLSPLAPFADGVAYSQPVTKIVVLMTDGENAAYNNNSGNASLYSGGGYIHQGRFGVTSGTALERRAALDARMAAVCTNLKATGIILYTIRVEVTSTTAGPLQACATDAGKFFDVKVASDLNATFDAIADSLLNLRIAG